MLPLLLSGVAIDHETCTLAECDTIFFVIQKGEGHSSGWYLEWASLM